MENRKLAGEMENPASLVDVGMSEKRQIHMFFNQPGHEALKVEFLRLNQISNLKSAGFILLQWLWIAVAIGFATGIGQWWSYLIAFVVIATRQNALLVIMHDATHWRLFSKRWANDFFGNLLCAFPTQIMVSRYRMDHLVHHQRNMNPGDPYKLEWDLDPHWHWPKTKSQALWLFVRDLFGFNLHHMGLSLWRWSPWSNHLSNSRFTWIERLSLYGFWILVFTGLSLAGAWSEFLILWFLPMSTLTVALTRARSSAEHIGLSGENEFNRTRHIDASFFEKLTIAPLNINMHMAHHLFPSVPQYNLPQLHQLLLQYPPYKEQGRIYDSYMGFGQRAYREMIK